MTNPLASPWIPALVLAGLTLVARLNQRSWVASSVFAPLTWSFYIFLPLVLAPEYKVPALGVWVVVLMVASVMAGATLSEGGDETFLHTALAPTAVRAVLGWWCYSVP